MQMCYSSSNFLAFFTIMVFLLLIVEAMGGDDNILPFKKRKLIHSFADSSNNVNESKIVEQPSTDLHTDQQMGTQQDQDQNKTSASSMSAHEKGKGIASHAKTSQPNENNASSSLWRTEPIRKLRRTMSGKLDAKAFFEPTSNSNGEIQKEMALRWGAHNYFDHIDKIAGHSPSTTNWPKKIIQISGPDEKEITEEASAAKLRTNSTSANGRRYLTKFKIQVVKYANKESVSNACQTFELSRSTVNLWIKKYGASLSFKKGKGRPRKFLKTGSPSYGQKKLNIKKRTRKMENSSADSSEPDV